jgi:hypothetical protein
MHSCYCKCGDHELITFMLLAMIGRLLSYRSLYTLSVTTGSSAAATAFLGNDSAVPRNKAPATRCSKVLLREEFSRNWRLSSCILMEEAAFLVDAAEHSCTSLFAFILPRGRKGRDDGENDNTLSAATRQHNAARERP